MEGTKSKYSYSNAMVGPPVCHSANARAKQLRQATSVFRQRVHFTIIKQPPNKTCFDCPRPATHSMQPIDFCTTGMFIIGKSILAPVNILALIVLAILKC
jgi:hypothetical protein